MCCMAAILAGVVRRIVFRSASALRALIHCIFLELHAGVLHRTDDLQVAIQRTRLSEARVTCMRPADFIHGRMPDVLGLQVGRLAKKAWAGRNDGERTMIQEFVRLLLRLLFPELRKKIIGALVFAGISLVSGPVWQPYANAILQHNWNITIPPADVFAGWILLSLGLVFLVAGEIWDQSTKRTVASPLGVADSKKLRKLFSTIHLPTFTKFFQHGRGTMIYFPVTHYVDELEGVIHAAQYQLDDQQLSAEANGLFQALSAALQQIDYFSPASNSDLLKFESKHDIYANPEAREARDGFLSAVHAAEGHLHSLCRLVSSKYPDFDFDVTNRLALDGYEETVRRSEEAKAAEAAAVSDFEVSVMGCILELEAHRQSPSLQVLIAVLRCERIHTQVALDRLIERGFVKHLYPGMSYQKFTVLKPGRAYYLASRERSL